MGDFTVWAILHFGRFYILGDFGVGDFEFFFMEWAILQFGRFYLLGDFGVGRFCHLTLNYNGVSRTPFWV